MKNILPIVLIVLAAFLGYMGFNKLNSSSSNLEIGPIEISAGSKEGKTEAYVMLGLAALSLIGGASMLAKK